MSSLEIKSLDQINYSLGLKKILLIIVLFFTFLVGFISTFPIASNIQNVIQKQLSASGCPVDFDDLKFELFFIPKVVIKNITIPGTCLGPSSSTIKIDQLNLKFHGPSFSPFGLALKLEVLSKKIPMELLMALAPSEQVISFKNQKFDLESLSSILPIPMKIQGHALLDLRGKLLQNRLIELDLDLNSKNLILPAQPIKSFNLPSIPLKVFNLKTKTDAPGKIKIINFVAGDQNSPLRAKFSGSLDLKSELGQSVLNLPGEFKFSDSFIEQYSFINLLVGQYNQKDGFYQIRLTGPLSSPSVLNQ